MATQFKPGDKVSVKNLLKPVYVNRVIRGEVIGKTEGIAAFRHPDMVECYWFEEDIGFQSFAFDESLLSLV